MAIKRVALFLNQGGKNIRMNDYCMLLTSISTKQMGAFGSIFAVKIAKTNEKNAHRTL